LLRLCEQTSKTARKLDPAQANSGLRWNWLSLSESGPIHENREAERCSRAEHILPPRGRLLKLGKQ
jgi:hypothetical protein